MKVYSWKILLVTVLIGGAAFFSSIIRLIRGDLWAVAEIIIFGGLIIEGISASMTQKGFQKEKENTQKSKNAYKALFGRAAFIMPYGAIICLCIAAILISVFPNHSWVAMIFIIAALIYQIWLTIVIRKEMKNEG